MSVVIAIQARSNSSRLPGKVLMPIGGYPLTVLAAKRAGRNADYKVMVLTSNQSSDDHLCSLLEAHSVDYFRGALDNLLEPYVSAFVDYSDQTIVVRLTADNVFPDSDFIALVVEQFISTKVDYLFANGKASRLPYAASLEVTTLGKLREAAVNALHAYEKEHVTPYIRKRYGESCYCYNGIKDFGHLRCTIDNFDDYVRMTKSFSSIVDPVSISTDDLIELFSAENSTVSEEASKLVLGSAQLGLDYGINNTLGKPSESDAHEILTEAMHCGVKYIDTARAYGSSEKVIGSWLKSGWLGRVSVITKLAPLSEINDNSASEAVDLSVRLSVFESLHNLSIDSLDVLMLHRAAHLTMCTGQILKTLIGTKETGLIKRLGVSVQSPEELALALEYAEISLIQMPFNILDNRWASVLKKIEKVKQERELSIHVRSVLLQGLIITGDFETWQNVWGDNSKQVIAWLEQQRAKHQCKSIGELAIRYVKSQPWVDALVLGAERLEQLKENIVTIKSLPFPSSSLIAIDEGRPKIINESLLNPALWRQK